MAGNRPRIKPKSAEGVVVIDELAFGTNRSSPNARKVTDVNEVFNLDIWFDKHFYLREYFGDDNGKRIGIDRAVIQDILIQSIKFLFYFTLKVKNFKFVNFKDDLRKLRIVIQRRNEEGELINLTAEFHHVRDNNYEVTVITAMATESFTFSEGQFILELVDEGSILRQKVHKTVNKIDEV